MIFIDRQRDPKMGHAYSNNPEGFIMPYDCYSAFEKEICEWKYYRLHNFPRHILNKRCNNFITRKDKPIF